MTPSETLSLIAKRLRIHSLRMTTKAGSGHPTTCLSMAEITAALFFGEMRWNPADPGDWGNDELVLSKGHAAPILWAAYAEAGVVPFEALLNLRKIGSDLEGHPTPRMPWVKTATGSLGQGLSVGAGMAAALRLGGSPARVFVVMGDGECAEGSVWEAANAAAGLRLNRLCAVIDVNRLGQSDPTLHQHDTAAYARKFEAFGWDTVVIDGHDMVAVSGALERAGTGPRPLAVVARTIKGKGVSFLEDRNGWHGKPLKEEELVRALAEIGPLPEVEASKLIRPAHAAAKPVFLKAESFPRTPYKDKTATRLAYGQALAALGRVDESVIAIDGDVKNSTYADKFFEAFPARSFQSYIAEQNMVGMGMGFAAKGYIPFMATFAAFLTRAHDQVRMAAYSYSNIKVCGSHVGVSIGEDGASQMGLEDLALFRSVPGCVVLYPGDAVCAEACVEIAARHKGMVYIRTTRPATALLYGPDEPFSIGGSKVLRKGPRDAATIIAAGITLHESLKAADALQAEGLGVRVIDAYSVQPLDAEGIRAAVAETRGRAVVVEDHYAGGGLGDAVASALAGQARLEHLCVRELPRSGKPDELLDAYGISARRIAAAVQALV